MLDFVRSIKLQLCPAVYKNSPMCVFDKVVYRLPAIAWKVKVNEKSGVRSHHLTFDYFSAFPRLDLFYLLNVSFYTIIVAFPILIQENKILDNTDAALEYDKGICWNSLLTIKD